MSLNSLRRRFFTSDCNFTSVQCEKTRLSPDSSGSINRTNTDYRMILTGHLSINKVSLVKFPPVVTLDQ
jgi:hypothetical protein